MLAEMANVHKSPPKSPRWDLNSRPLVYKTSALTTELRRHDHQRTKLERSSRIFTNIAIATLFYYSFSIQDSFNISILPWHFQQSGAEEACWAHNPEVGGSKPPSATNKFSPNMCDKQISSTSDDKYSNMHELQIAELPNSLRLPCANVLYWIFWWEISSRFRSWDLAHAKREFSQWTNGASLIIALEQDFYYGKTRWPSG